MGADSRAATVEQEARVGTRGLVAEAVGPEVAEEGMGVRRGSVEGAGWGVAEKLAEAHLGVGVAPAALVD